jgi:thiamine-phosphate pyrophosphorylase
MNKDKKPFYAGFNRSIYVISDDIPVLKKAVADGAAIVQLRDKSGAADVTAKKAQELVAYKASNDFLFILNDSPELAVKVGADGVHIGQDFSTAEARKIVGPNLLLGKSTHSLEQGQRAQAEGADYLSVGPVFATPTKPGRPAVGLAAVREAAAGITIPFVAIGGIDVDNAGAVLAAGARTLGVVRAAPRAAVLLKMIKDNLVKIRLNGRDEYLSADSNIEKMALALGLKPEGIVVELNGRIIKKNNWQEFKLEENDTVELISFVGGG